jgi:hypothetical protein
MKNFLINLLSNRFGIALATTNVVYFLIKMPVTEPFPRPLLGKLFLAINAPALILSRLADETVLHFFTGMSYESQFQLAIFSITIFVVIQWLFVAWAARQLAVKLRSNPA